tara:strand:+ start:3946 stop:5877 length:1932 start_codon:yes stop_codon:yes gene_type:complete
MNPVSRIFALDGVRGLAVLAVVIYHAWPSALPGGWIGVSVFFTLSGFLITQIVVRDHEMTPSSMAIFWGRRARRLLPAVIATIVITVITVAVIDSDLLRGVSEEGIAAIFYVHNWWAISETGGYWEIFNSDPRPFAHLWSLSIEEQVYLFWPLLIILLGLRKALMAGAIVIAIGLFIWWGNADAYFATPFRFAEVFAGAVLAYVVKKNPKIKISGFLTAIAAGGLIWGVFVLKESDPFVTQGALLLIGTAAMVVTGYAQRETKANLFVGSKPLAWLGQRSYAIYLFHWPFLELLDTSPFLAIGLTLLTAEVSHHVLEWPIRTGKRIKRPLPTLGLVSLTSALALVIVIAVAPRPASQQEISDAVAAAFGKTTTTTTTTTTLLVEEVPTSSTTQEEHSTTSSSLAPDTSENDPETQENVYLSANPKVAIMGDSIAQYLGPALDGWIDAVGGEIGIYGFTLCSPVFTEENYEFFTITLWDQESVFGPLKQPCRRSITLEYDLVLVFDHAAIFFEHENIQTEEKYIFPDTLELISESYTQLIQQTKIAGASLIFFTAPQQEDRPVCLILGEKRPYRENLEIYNTFIKELAETENHVFVFDTAAMVESNADRYPRPDCIHFEAFDVDGGAINFVADFVFPRILVESP